MSDPDPILEYEAPARGSRRRRWAARAATTAVRLGRVLTFIPLLPNGCLAMCPAGTSMRPMGPWALIVLCAALGLLVPLPLGILSVVLGRGDPVVERRARFGLLFGALATVGGIAGFFAIVYLRGFKLEE